MSGKPRQRFAAPQQIEAQSFRGANPQYKNPNGGTGMSSVLFAPFDRDRMSWGIVIMSYIAELIGTFVFVLATVLAASGVPGGSTPIDLFLGGTFVAAIAGVAYYMSTGLSLESAEERYADLPRQLSATVTLANMLVMRTGIVPGLFYLVSQFLGVLCAAGALYGLGSYAVPSPSTASHIWTVEFLGVFAIILPMLFKQLAATSLEAEKRGKRTANLFAAGGRAVATAVLFSKGGWAFDPMVYMGGFLSQCFVTGVCPANSPFDNATAFYFLVPLLFVVPAVLVYLLHLLLISTVGSGYRIANKTTLATGRNDPSAEYEQAQAPIRASLPTTTAQDLDKYN